MKVSPLKEIGQRIMRFRDQGGITPTGGRWSREEFAEMVGINPTYLYEIEMGEKEMGVLILGSMCKVLGCEPNDIMGGIPGFLEEVHRRHEELARVHTGHRDLNGAHVNGERKVASY
jgi:DNA-binding Xre family transcriptional regulator